MTDSPTEILHATHRALREHGYARMTMQDIADETDLSTAAIHYHYDCKHDLLVAFLDHLYDRFEVRIRDLDGDTAADRLHDLIDRLLTDRSKTPAFRTALLEIKAQAPYDDAFRDRLQRFDDAFAATVHNLVANGIETGAFRDDLDPETVASFLTTFMNGAQTRHVGAGHPPGDAAATAHRYVKTALRPVGESGREPSTNDAGSTPG